MSVSGGNSGVNPFTAMYASKIKFQGASKQEEAALKDIADHYKDINGGKAVNKQQVSDYFQKHTDQLGSATPDDMQKLLAANGGSLGNLLFRGDDKFDEGDVKEATAMDAHIDAENDKLKSDPNFQRDSAVILAIQQNKDAIANGDSKFSQDDVKTFFKNNPEKLNGISQSDLEAAVTETRDGGLVGETLFKGDKKASTDDLDFSAALVNQLSSDSAATTGVIAGVQTPTPTTQQGI